MHPQAFIFGRHFSQDVEIDDLIPCDKYGKPLFAQLEGESGSPTFVHAKHIL